MPKFIYAYFNKDDSSGNMTFIVPISPADDEGGDDNNSAGTSYGTVSIVIGNG